MNEGRPQGALGVGLSGPVLFAPDYPYKWGITAHVKADSTAFERGLFNGDLIVAVADNRLDKREIDDSISYFHELINAHHPGEWVRLTVSRNQQLFDVWVDLETKGESFRTLKTPSSWLEKKSLPSKHELMFNKLLAKGQKDYLERWQRLNKTLQMMFQNRDEFLLEPVAKAYTHPFAAEKVVLDLIKNKNQLIDWAELYGKNVNIANADEVISQMNTLDRAMNIIFNAISNAKKQLDQAFMKFNPTEKNFVGTHFQDLIEVISQGDLQIDLDEDSERLERNILILSYLKKISLEDIFVSYGYLSLITSKQFVQKLALLCAKHPQHDQEIILQKSTSLGDIIFAGTASNLYQQDALYLFDLGGNDRYWDMGAANGFDEKPFRIILDWQGDDIYSATKDGNLTSSVAGISLLKDFNGNDTYLAQSFSLGATIGGLSLVKDYQGDDLYQSRYFTQGAGLYGVGKLEDLSGNDIYNGAGVGQGVGIAGGIGILKDHQGDDHYTLKSERPSGYGTLGNFKSIGQGVGFGIRGRTTGGIGLLQDIQGNDHYVAGNWAQGGGYSFGLGALIEGGGNDHYIGGHYSQGFSAHQAVGVLSEQGGNDFYRAIYAVGTGIAWDQSVSVFHEYLGSDHYQLYDSFSMATAANNGVVLFLEDQGDDHYFFTPSQTRGNSYHSGSSMAFFMDQQGNDHYQIGKAQNNVWGLQAKDALFIDFEVNNEIDVLGGTNIYQ